MIIELMGAENKLFNLFVMVPILLIFGEITPKTLAIKNNIAFATFESLPIDNFARLISPVRWVVRIVADFFTTLVARNFSSYSESPTLFRKLSPHWNSLIISGKENSHSH